MLKPPTGTPGTLLVRRIGLGDQVGVVLAAVETEHRRHAVEEEQRGDGGDAPGEREAFPSKGTHEGRRQEARRRPEARDAHAEAAVVARFDDHDRLALAHRVAKNGDRRRRWQVVETVEERAHAGDGDVGGVHRATLAADASLAGRFDRGEGLEVRVEIGEHDLDVGQALGEAHPGSAAAAAEIDDAARAGGREGALEERDDRLEAPRDLGEEAQVIGDGVSEDAGAPGLVFDLGDVEAPHGRTVRRGRPRTRPTRVSVHRSVNRAA